MNRKLLFVDDEPQVLDGLRRLLSDHRQVWDMSFVKDPKEALSKSMETDFDVIISDISMPLQDGFELLRTLRNIERTKDIPVVILTGMNEKGLKQKALDLGATDILNKPVDREELLARLNNCLRLKTYLDEIKNYSVRLEQTVKERTRELHDTRLEVIRRLGRAAEYRDNETGMHVIRMSLFSALLGLKAGMSEQECDLLLNASPMHDIGKIGIPDRILLKPGKLDEEEWEIMKTHVTIGAEILAGDDSELLKLACTIVMQHHEKWDGSGYPLGLKGEEISLPARIVSLCDVFDALTSERPYKTAWPLEKTMKYIQEQKGKHFDPRLVEHFKVILPEIVQIQEKFSDTETPDQDRAEPLSLEVGSSFVKSIINAGNI
ncbi:MAG: HD-GYP domain-containing protein [Nitrospinaceae bacterium]